jgi:acyl-CoA thioesterase I
MGMKYGIGIGALLLIGLSWWFFMAGDDVITNYPPKNDTIVAFGDSLVYGQGSTKGNDFVSVLGRRIGRTIVNLGVPGDTTKDGVLRMDDVATHDPGLVLLLLGGNDTLRRVPVTESEANLRTLIAAFQKRGAVVMFIGVRGGIIGSDREAMYERVAAELGAIYVSDILEGILLTPELMDDSIHPNDAGYARIAERLHGLFKEYKL